MKSALKLLDDASEAIQYNRDLLQSALDQVHQGIAVFDRDCSSSAGTANSARCCDLPASVGRFGVPLDQIVRHMAAKKRQRRGAASRQFVSDRIRKYVVTMETFQERLDDAAARHRGAHQRHAAGRHRRHLHRHHRPRGRRQALERANETLERRVRERTAELTQVNGALAEAKAKADEANLDKTRFLAAASHDILQPLNAARLYTTSLVERKPPGEFQHLARNIDTSLEAVEEILNALLDISRLDTGALKPEIGVFADRRALAAAQGGVRAAGAWRRGWR